jgi:hypothetical protein
MTSELNSPAIKKPRGRNWVWWLKWVFASYGFAVGGFILLLVCSMPFLGPPKAVERLLDIRGPVLLALLSIGALVSYRHLK